MSVVIAGSAVMTPSSRTYFAVGRNAAAGAGVAVGAAAAVEGRAGVGTGSPVLISCCIVARAAAGGESIRSRPRSAGRGPPRGASVRRAQLLEHGQLQPRGPLEPRVQRAPRRLGRRRDELGAALVDQPRGRRPGVRHLARDAHVPRDLPADLDVVDQPLLRRVRDLERRAAGVEDRDVRTVAALVGLELLEPEHVPVERQRRVVVLRLDDQPQLPDRPTRAVGRGRDLLPRHRHAVRIRTGASAPIPSSSRSGSGSSSIPGASSSSRAVAGSVSTVLGSAMSVSRAATLTDGPNTSPNRDSTRPHTTPTRTGVTPRAPSASPPAPRSRSTSRSPPSTRASSRATRAPVRTSSATNSTASPIVLTTRPPHWVTTSRAAVSNRCTKSDRSVDPRPAVRRVNDTMSANPTARARGSAAGSPSVPAEPPAANSTAYRAAIDARCRR